MGRRDENILGLLAQQPWWVSVSVAAIVYTALRFLVPAFTFDNAFLRAFASASPQFAWTAAIFLLPAVVAAFGALRNRRMLDRQSGIESIRALPWKQFEALLAEAYRRQGYSVLESPYAGPDGGIDLTIKRHGNVYLVQCKQWRAVKVGVTVVREMLGLVTAHTASGAIIVTSGMFTQEARTFAAGKPIDLVEGHQLVGLIGAVQTRPLAAESAGPTLSPQTSVASARPDAGARRCSRCGRDLVLRVARRGSRAGDRFWGCSGYPRCNHTEQYEG